MSLTLLVAPCGCDGVDYEEPRVLIHGSAVTLDMSAGPKRVFVCSDQGLDGFVDDIADAIDVWNSHAARDVFRLHEECFRYDGVNLVNARDITDVVEAGISMYACDGHICDAGYLTLYSGFFGQPKPVRIYELAHELGHFLGLGHKHPNGCIMHSGGVWTDIPCQQELDLLSRMYPGIF